MFEPVSLQVRARAFAFLLCKFFFFYRGPWGTRLTRRRPIRPSKCSMTPAPVDPGCEGRAACSLSSSLLLPLLLMPPAYLSQDLADPHMQQVST